jgi:hypothetical protein
MLRSGQFWIGVLVGVGGVAAYHRWVKPMPTTKAA